MSKTSFILFALFLLAQTAISQHINTLKSNLSADTTSDQHKAELYNDIIDYYSISDHDIAWLYADSAVAFKENHPNTNLTSTYQQMANLAIRQDNMKLARKYIYKAYDLLDENPDSLQAVSIFLTLGNIEISLSNYFEAKQVYLRGLAISEEKQLHDISAHFYNNLGVIAHSLDNLNEAFNYIEKALELFELSGQLEDGLNSIVNLALIHLSRGDTVNTIIYAERALKEYKNLPDHPGLAEVYTILIPLQLHAGNIETAIDYANKVEEICNNIPKSYAGPKNELIAESIQSIGMLYLQLNQLDKAKSYLYRSKAIHDKVVQLFADKSYLNGLSIIHEREGNYDSSLYYLKIYKEIDDQENARNLKDKIGRLEIKADYEKALERSNLEMQMQMNKEEGKKKRLTLWILIVITLLLAALTMMGFLVYYNKSKEHRLKLNEEQLEAKNKELLTTSIYAISKHEFITSVNEKLTKAKIKFNKQQCAMIDEIICDMKSKDPTDSWLEFEHRFNEVNNQFYVKLNNQFPNLSPNEVRLCALLRLNMSTKEISSITHQSIQSITMARYRLRKKLQLNTNVNLVTFLTNV